MGIQGSGTLRRRASMAPSLQGGHLGQWGTFWKSIQGYIKKGHPGSHQKGHLGHLQGCHLGQWGTFWKSIQGTIKQGHPGSHQKGHLGHLQGWHLGHLQGWHLGQWGTFWKGSVALQGRASRALSGWLSRAVGPFQEGHPRHRWDGYLCRKTSHIAIILLMVYIQFVSSFRIN